MKGCGPPRQVEGWDAGAPMSAPKFLGAIWGFTRPFERISRFWRIDFIPRLQKSAYFEIGVKSDSRRLLTTRCARQSNLSRAVADSRRRRNRQRRTDRDQRTEHGCGGGDRQSVLHIHRQHLARSGRLQLSTPKAAAFIRRHAQESGGL